MHMKNRVSRFNICSKQAGSGEIRAKESRYSWVSTQKPASVVFFFLTSRPLTLFQCPILLPVTQRRLIGSLVLKVRS